MKLKKVERDPHFLLASMYFDTHSTPDPEGSGSQCPPCIIAEDSASRGGVRRPSCCRQHLTAAKMSSFHEGGWSSRGDDQLLPWSRRRSINTRPMAEARRGPRGPRTICESKRLSEALSGRDVGLLAPHPPDQLLLPRSSECIDSALERERRSRVSE